MISSALLMASVMMISRAGQGPWLDLRSEALAQRQLRVPSAPFDASFIQLNFEGGIRITVIGFWIGHVPRGLAITQEIAIAHIAKALAYCFDVFGVGLNAQCTLRLEETGGQDNTHAAS
jgi:hypothetical protein